MTKKTFYFAFFLIFLSLTVLACKNANTSIASNQNAPHEHTNVVKKVNPLTTESVEDFCRLIESNKAVELQNFVTNVPDVFIKKSQESMKKYLSKDVLKSDESNISKYKEVKVPAYRSSDQKEEIVKIVIPTLSTFQENKRKFQKVISLKQNETEAKVLVAFNNDDSPVQTEYEILMIMEQGQWKVFSFAYPNRYAETYGEPTV